MDLASRLNRAIRRVPPWTIYLCGFGWSAWLFWQAASGAMGADPVKGLEHALGKLGLQLLVAVLCITPLRKLLNWPWLLRLRAETRRDHPFLIWAPFDAPARPWTYGEFHERVGALAACAGLQSDRVARACGVLAAWALLLACLISAGNATLRYTFSLGSNAWLEAQWYLFGLAVFAGAPLLLRLNEHVRVDVVYGGRSPRTKAWIDLLGLALVLLPVCVVTAWMAWPFAVESYLQQEHSPSAGGLLRWPPQCAFPAPPASQVCNLSWSKNVNELVSTHGYSQNQIIVWRYPTMQVGSVWRQPGRGRVSGQAQRRQVAGSIAAPGTTSRQAH